MPRLSVRNPDPSGEWLQWEDELDMNDAGEFVKR